VVALARFGTRAVRELRRAQNLERALALKRLLAARKIDRRTSHLSYVTDEAILKPAGGIDAIVSLD
jgi:hypothetical protein